MSGRMNKSACQLLDGLDISCASPRRVGALAAHEGLMLEVAGFPMPLGTNVCVQTGAHSHICGEIVGFHGDRSLIMPFETNAPLVTGARVERFDSGGDVTCGKALLGRIIDAHGAPLDSKPAIVSRFTWPLAGKRSNPLTRGRVVKPFDTGVRPINGLLTVGEGQRVAIIAGSGVGKSVLMGQMLAGSDCDVIVVGLIGERSREVSDFIETKLPPTVRGKSVVVAVPADHSPILRLRAAMRASAIAEYFRQEGKRVLLLIDSLTRVAHAQREIGLSLGEPPTMKGYPPSALSLIPQLVERAGVDRLTGGSITALYTVLADGGDVDDPVVDAARAIVDGHIILSRTLAEKGLYPAIDIARSLSRTMADVVDSEHQQAAANLRLLWSVYEENRDMILMGAYAAGNDALLDEAIRRRDAILAYIGQPAAATINLPQSRASLIEGFGA
jgi:flagellum-specific ATP synthase